MQYQLSLSLAKYLKELSIINSLSVYWIVVFCVSTKIQIPCAPFNSYSLIRGL